MGDMKFGNMKCPKRYGAYDIMNHDCDDCGQGLLYQTCRDGKNHFACAGWLDPNTDEPLCCIHYEKRHSSNKSE